MAADDQDGPDLADPKEHPEQHAALQTGRQGEAAPPAEEADGALAHEEHSEEDGAFGTG
jgi:hypothetical protein